MVKQSTRASLVIALILFVAFNILSMVESKKHQVRHQCQNNHGSHQHCPNPKHYKTNRKKRSDLLTMNPILLNKNHTFDVFYNSKFDERNMPFSQQISHEKLWNNEGKRENYLEGLEKIFGRFPQRINVRRINKSLEPAKKFNRKFLQNENIQQILNSLEEEESPNLIRVKRDNSKFNQISSPSMSSEYLQNLAESFAGPSEAEETQNLNTKEIENDEKMIQNLGYPRKRNIHRISSTNKHKNRAKRDRDPDEFKTQRSDKNSRIKKELLNSKNKQLEKKNIHKTLKTNLKEKNTRSSNKNLANKKQNQNKEKKITEKKNILEKKHDSSKIEKKRRSEKNLKRKFDKNKNRNGLKRKRRYNMKEANDLYGSLKSSSSLEEIKNLAENLISKIDHLGEFIRKHRMERNSHELSSNNPSKDNSIS